MQRNLPFQVVVKNRTMRCAEPSPASRRAQRCAQAVFHLSHWAKPIGSRVSPRLVVQGRAAIRRCVSADALPRARWLTARAPGWRGRRRAAPRASARRRADRARCVLLWLQWCSCAAPEDLPDMSTLECATCGKDYLRLPEALKRGLANLDEQAVVALEE